MRRRHPRPRLLLPLALLLLAGAGITAAIAWTLAATATIQPDPLGWPHPGGRGGGWSRDVEFTLLPGVGGRIDDTFIAGWPLPALGRRDVYWYDRSARDFAPEPGWLIVRGIPAPAIAGRKIFTAVAAEACIPILPLPGFALDTLFYSAALMLPLGATIAIRRRLRIHRNRCAMCGYDLSGLTNDAAPCPECGAERVSR